MRIVVAMSGGVDSSTVAGLLVEQGHEVIGLAMKTHNLEPRANRACCTPDDMRDARRVADALGIPFYVLNYAEVFAQQVIKPFAESYRRGHTPNPCVECNDKVKFEPLLKRAKLLGADALATGHYARIVQDGPVRYLQRGRDGNKDQSYFLYRLTQEQLHQLQFPLGDMSKDQVRDAARRLGLPVAEKQESQEICFVGAEGYAKTVEKILGDDLPAKGSIVHESGEVLGEHAGIHHFTLGQRKGLGIAYAEPLYVIGIDAATNTVQVGSKERLQAQEIALENVRWSSGTPPALDELIFVQQRYRSRAHPAYVRATDSDGARIAFVAPESRGAPGQAAVVYDEDGRVLGGGTIATSRTQRRLNVVGQGLASQL